MRVLCWIFLVAIAAKAETVLGELNRAGMREKSIKVDPGSFTENNVVRLCRVELRRKPRANVTILHVYGERGAAPLPQPVHGHTYEYWRGFYDSQSQLPNEIAEMVAIGKNAVLRMRDASGRVTRRVLAGRDPLLIGLQGTRFEIVHLAFSPARPYIFQRASVYVRTAEPLETAPGLELLGILRPVFPDLEVSVYIRNDAWFIHEAGYPFFNPLVEDEIPPSPDEYRTPTLRCGHWTGAPACFAR